MAHENEFASSGSSPSPDFTIRDEGTIVLLVPHTQPARSWIDEHIGPDNGYQPYYPTVVIEHRYARPILEGIRESGFSLISGGR